MPNGEPVRINFAAYQLEVNDVDKANFILTLLREDGLSLDKGLLLGEVY